MFKLVPGLHFDILQTWEPYYQLREEVDEVLRGEHHRGVQRNHEAGPQSQVQICSQFLHTHKHKKVKPNEKEEEMWGTLHVTGVTLLKSWRM